MTWAGSTAATPSPVARTKPSWATKKTLSSGPPKRDETPVSSISHSGPRLIIFVIGGMTYSEIRSCHQVSDEFKRGILIGM